jgi:hypothetical protein
MQKNYGRLAIKRAGQLNQQKLKSNLSLSDKQKMRSKKQKDSKKKKISSLHSLSI